MNENPTTPPEPARHAAPAIPPLPDRSDRIRREYLPMEKPPGALSSAEALLRQPGRIVYELTHERAGAAAGYLLAVALICLLAYGVTAGMFSWGDQIWAAPLKIALGQFLSALICLPSLVIFSCLAGSKATIADVGRLLVGMLSLTALLLLGFAPVSWIFAQSTESIAFMAALHFAFWGIGIYHGLRFLYEAAGFLDGRRLRHLVTWSAIFILVCLQMTTTLRPILGTSDSFLQTGKKFFVTHWMDGLTEDLE
jgi:hypothetical protein